MPCRSRLRYAIMMLYVDAAFCRVTPCRRRYICYADAADARYYTDAAILPYIRYISRHDMPCCYAMLLPFMIAIDADAVARAMLLRAMHMPLFSARADATRAYADLFACYAILFATPPCWLLILHAMIDYYAGYLIDFPSPPPRPMLLIDARLPRAHK